MVCVLSWPDCPLCVWACSIGQDAAPGRPGVVRLNSLSIGGGGGTRPRDLYPAHHFSEARSLGTQMRVRQHPSEARGLVIQTWTHYVTEARGLETQPWAHHVWGCGPRGPG